MATYACSDLHGMLSIFEQICEILEPDDIVYFLGDAGDRGPEPWETIKRVAEHPQFIYLKGNHEDMLEKALIEHKKDLFDNYRYRILYRNGGEETFEQSLKEEDVDKWIVFLQGLPAIKTYYRKDGNLVILTHAGFHPYFEDEELYIPDDYDLIWDRDHIYDPKWRYEDKNIYIIHGHTPIPIMKEELFGEICNSEEEEENITPFWYCEGRKCCIDAGAFFTGEFCLLDLDTFEYHHFSTSLKKSF